MGEWGNGELGIGNREWGIGNGEWGLYNLEFPTKTQKPRRNAFVFFVSLWFNPELSSLFNARSLFWFGLVSVWEMLISRC